VFGVGLTVHGVVVWCWLNCTWCCVFGVGLTEHGVVVRCWLNCTWCCVFGVGSIVMSIGAFLCLSVSVCLNEIAD
jgi:hypothetical protein